MERGVRSGPSCRRPPFRRGPEAAYTVNNPEAAFCDRGAGDFRRASANPTRAVKVKWAVTFSDAVTGVDLGDFRLKPSGGLRGASLVSVTGSGNVWTVTAKTGRRPGKLGLNLVDDDSIQDSAGNKLGGVGLDNGSFTGARYTKR